MTLALADPLGGARWNFVFSDRFGRSTKHYELTKGATITVDPLDRLEFLTGVTTTSTRGGAALSIQPRLETGVGLLINTCYRGTYDTGRDATTATITLSTPEGEVLATAQSGFV
ncbi:MAG TPA: hypothetical protein VGX78_17250 [Pirellulales bacterium]|jgi:hypothetical protein|nr:hypothetical protein [Pirellulales bacterium]